MKEFFIYLIRLYQKYARDRIRQSCRFVPSCSAYMILSVEKYGFSKGIMKGLNRIGRCKMPNGGVDFP